MVKIEDKELIRWQYYSSNRHLSMLLRIAMECDGGRMTIADEYLAKMSGVPKDKAIQTLYEIERTGNIIVKPCKGGGFAITLVRGFVFPKPKKGVNDEKRKDFKERELQFGQTLIPYMDTYGKEMIRDFYDYWREPNKSGTLMRWELQKTWNVEGRLRTWNKNNFNNYGRGNRANYTLPNDRYTAKQRENDAIQSSIMADLAAGADAIDEE